MRVGSTSEDELERMIRDGGRRGEIYTSCSMTTDTPAISMDILSEGSLHRDFWSGSLGTARE